MIVESSKLWGKNFNSGEQFYSPSSYFSSCQLTVEVYANEVYISTADTADYLCIRAEDDTWRYHIIWTGEHMGESTKI